MRSKIALAYVLAVLVLLLAAGPAYAAGSWLTTGEGANVLDPHPQAGDSASWSGAKDAENYATGPGVLQFFFNDTLTATLTGTGYTPGKIVATAGGKPLGEAPIIALAAVERAGFVQRIGQRVSGWFSK